MMHYFVWYLAGLVFGYVFGPFGVRYRLRGNAANVARRKK
jgi:hypothetical protein